MKEFDWFDRPGVRRGLWIALVAACVLSVAAEFLVHRHPHFGFDSFFGFYAVLGFAACAASILVAKVLGFALKKPEDFYGPEPDEDPADLDPERDRTPRG